MNFQRYFSPILSYILEANLLTLSVVNSYTQLVDNLYISTDFQSLQNVTKVDNLFTAQNLMCMMRYSNLRLLFYKQYPQAINIYTSIFLRKKKEE